MGDDQLFVRTYALAALHVCPDQARRSVLLYTWANGSCKLRNQGFQVRHRGSRTGLSPGSESSHFVLFDVGIPDMSSPIGVLHDDRLLCLAHLRAELGLLVDSGRNSGILVRYCVPLCLLQAGIVLLRLFAGLRPRSSKYVRFFLWSLVSDHVFICSSEMAIPIPNMMRSTVLAHMLGYCSLTSRSPAVHMSTGCTGICTHYHI